MKGMLVVFEGVCCSGKTTLCKMVVEELQKRGVDVIYNHGAFTKTERGKKLRSESIGTPMELTTVSYIADLIADTKEFIVSALDAGKIVIQDRYFDAITTYIAAYEKTQNRRCDIYDAADVLTECGILLIPDKRIFCTPPLETVVKRMKISKASEVHDLYRNKPELLKMVYEELNYISETYLGAITIGTISMEVALETSRILADELVERGEINDCKQSGQSSSTIRR